MHNAAFINLCPGHYSPRQRAARRQLRARQALAISAAALSLINLARVLGWLP